MDESQEYGRRFPPRSKFNDEEATAVLRLIIEQEKLLKSANVTPLLNVSTNRLQRLPPLHPKRSESLDENELESVRTRKSSAGHNADPGSEFFYSKPTLLTRSKVLNTSDNSGTLPGKPSRIPDIYSCPKIARHRDRGDRPKGSYGRTRPENSKSLDSNDHIIDSHSSVDSGYVDEGENKNSNSHISRYSPSYIN